MPPAPTKQSNDRPGPWLARLFLTLLLVPALTVLWHRDEEFPLPQNLNDILTLQPDLKHYFAANFALRNRLAGLNHRAMRSLNGNAGNQSLTRQGLDGWLFNFNYRRKEADFGAPPATLRHSLEEAERKHEICRQMGIIYLPLIVPSKASVYHEYLPDRVRRQMGTPGEVSEWHRYWVTKADGIRPIDLIRPMRDRRNDGPVYFKTDSHWSEFGAYIAAEEVLRELRTSMPGLPLPYREKVTFDSFPCDPGNEARILGIEKQISETYVRPVLPESRNVVTIDNQPPVVHAINLTGAQDKVLLLRCPQGELESAIVFNNSFGIALIPYLSRYFQETRFAWLNFDPDLIRTHRPTVVVELFTSY